MHTAESTPTEVALSKLAAAIAVARGAEQLIRDGDLSDALERIDKAGTKLVGAALAIEEHLPTGGGS